MPPMGMNPFLIDVNKRTVIATYDNYLDAQAAVDKLSDNRFPVQHVSIVGLNLRIIETVLGRMTWGRAAGGGLLIGAWFGLLLGLFVSLFTTQDSTEGYEPYALILMGLLYGAAFGIIFGLVSHAFTAGRRDFSARSQILAQQYEVRVDPEVVADAQRILGLGGAAAPAPPAAAPGSTAPGGPNS